MKNEKSNIRNNRGAIYRHEVKELIQQQALLGLTAKEIKEKCIARFPEYDFTDQKIRDFIRNHHIERVKPKKNNVMTPEEKDYAENNINIIYDYLHKKELEIDEWFDIVVFGYLDAVMDYHRKKELRKYAFTTIAWHTMNRELNNYITRIKAQKRSCEIKFLDMDMKETESGTGLHEMIPDQSAERQYHTKIFWHDMNQLIHEKFNEEQQKHLYLLYCGYKPREITDKLKISKEKQKKNKTYMQMVFQKAVCFPRCTGATM